MKLLSARPTVSFPAADCRASSPFDQYQIILLSDRSTDVCNNLPHLHMTRRSRKRDLSIVNLMPYWLRTNSKCNNVSHTKLKVCACLTVYVIEIMELKSSYWARNDQINTGTSRDIQVQRLSCREALYVAETQLSCHHQRQ